MVYRYLVVSKSKHKIHLGEVNNFYAGGIETSILVANRQVCIPTTFLEVASNQKQVYNEAAKILYDENKCLAGFSSYFSGVAFRIDEPKTKNITSKSLRSGQTVDMVKYKGLIYEKTFQRLRHVEFHVDTFNRTSYCKHLSLLLARRTQTHLWELYVLLRRRMQMPKQEHGRDWTVVIHSSSPMGSRLMHRVFEPLLTPTFARAVTLGKMSLQLEGKFPETWKKVFRHHKGECFITDKVEAVDTTSADLSSVDLELYFDYDEDEFDMYH
jgi:hypothetical protein